MTLKIEVGKEYVTRGGEVVRCDRAIEPGTRGYENSVFWMQLPGGGCYVVTKDGDVDTPSRPHPLDIISEHHAAEPAPADEAQIVYMVERFLNWKLPENFNPDGGISFERVVNKGTPHEYRYEPSGTNLFDYTQAEAMVRHMLEGYGSAPADDYSDELSNETLDRLAKIAAGLEFEPADEPESLRDKFAMAALTGLLSDSGTNATPWSSIAADAYRYADAMMEARKKP